MKTISRAMSKSNGPWYPAAGGKEKPFRASSGARLLYVFQPSTGRHAYLDVHSDVVLSDEDAEKHMVRRGVKGNPVKKPAKKPKAKKSKLHALAFGELPRGPRSAARPQLDLDLIRRVQVDERRHKSMPCACGNHDATWYGDTMRMYACDNCFKKFRQGNPTKKKATKRQRSAKGRFVKQSKSKAKRLSNPVYDALIPNPVKIPFKLMQAQVRMKGSSK